MTEKMLRWFEECHGLRWTALRYFNACGAHPDGDLGECHDPETHLIPNILRAITGEIPHLEVYGTDYPTPDGTAIRDYIHVLDLAEAHIKALDHLGRAGECGVLNLGTGKGRSVREVVRVVEEVTGRKVPLKECPRRPGDPPELVADPQKAVAKLGWKPRWSSIELVAETAWKWETRKASFAAH